VSRGPKVGCLGSKVTLSLYLCLVFIFGAEPSEACVALLVSVVACKVLSAVIIHGKWVVIIAISRVISQKLLYEILRLWTD